MCKAGAGDRVELEQSELFTVTYITPLVVFPVLFKGELGCFSVFLPLCHSRP